MTRAIFEKDQLSHFLDNCEQKTKLSLPQIAKIISVDRHTLNDWRREKLRPSLEKLTIISEFANIPLPFVLEKREETWGSTKAGIIRQQKYGCTLTMEQRIKGGHKSQVARKENPEYYRLLGCNTRKQFVFPSKNNPYFAEFIGIMLGDGHIGKNGQISITLNSVADHEYLGYVVQLISQLFGHSPSYFKEKIFKAVNIYLSGKDIVDFLVSSGMKIGDKVKQQVDVPE